jgi:competence protein ComEC
MIAYRSTFMLIAVGLLGSMLGNVAPALAYPLNVSNGFLVAVLEWVARLASAFPFAAVTTPGITPPLVGFFYLGCIPAALSETVFPRERGPLWAAVLVLWTALWLALVGVGSF